MCTSRSWMALLLAGASALAGPARLGAQAPADPARATGDLALVPGADAGRDAAAVPSASRAQAADVLERVLEVLHRDPAASSPRGHVLRGYRLFNREPAPLAPNLGMSYGLELHLIPFVTDEQGRLSHARLSSGAGVMVDVNQVGCFLRPLREPDAGGTEAAAERLLAVTVPGLDEHGRDAAGDELDRCIVLARADRPLWLPVDRERFLQEAIRVARLDRDGAVASARRGLAQASKPIGLDDPNTRAAYEQIKKMDPAAAERMLQAIQQAQQQQPAAQQGWSGMVDSANAYRTRHVRALEAELAALTPAERHAPAFADPHWRRADHALATPGDSAGLAVVVLNPAYFDRTLPASAPQLVTVSATGYDDDRPFLLDILRQLDRPALRALINGSRAQ